MGAYHTIEQGEHLSRIASEYGFHSYLPIWNAPENQELRQSRKNPNILYPGDRLYIPDRDLREEQKPTDKHHKFTVSADKLKLRLRFEHGYDKRIANAPCRLRISTDAASLTTDGGGTVERTIDRPLVSEEDAEAKLQERVAAGGRQADRDLTVSLKIGHLDPVEEVSGQIGRLRNLGYYPLPGPEPDAKLFRAAMEEFQCEHDLTVDGICGPQTQAKLKQVYGC